MSDNNLALTAQEWAAIQAQGVDWSGYQMTRQQLAALALHGQPFGFTREDLKLIDDAIGTVRELAPEFDVPTDAYSIMRDWVSLRSRIEALLPPEVPHGK